MNKHLLIVILAVLVPIQLPAQQSSQSKETNTGAPSSTQHIKGKGCVRPGRQSGCLVVNDIKAHRKYNVFFYRKDLPVHCNRVRRHWVRDRWKSGDSLASIASSGKDPNSVCPSALLSSARTG